VARRALFSGTRGRGRLLPVQRLGGMIDATAGVHPWAGLGAGAVWPVAARAQQPALRIAAYIGVGAPTLTWRTRCRPDVNSYSQR
jgi:hypothetical protein